MSVKAYEGPVQRNSLMWSLLILPVVRSKFIKELACLFIIHLLSITSHPYSAITNIPPLTSPTQKQFHQLPTSLSFSSGAMDEVSNDGLVVDDSAYTEATRVGMRGDSRRWSFTESLRGTGHSLIFLNALWRPEYRDSHTYTSLSAKPCRIIGVCYWW